MIGEIIVGILICIGFGWLAIDFSTKYQLKKLRRKYEPGQDKSRKRIEGGDSSVIPGEPSIKGVGEYERRELLPIPINTTNGTNEPIPLTAESIPIPAQLFSEPKPKGFRRFFGKKKVEEKKEEETL
jgi:hypothetical protein